MSIAEIERFAADLKSNEALRGEAAKAPADQSQATPVARAVAFAASKGYAFTVDEAKEHIKAKAKTAGKELTDAELDGVAGGIWPSAAASHGSAQTYATVAAFEAAKGATTKSRP